jgi:hypothetical protein
MDTDTGGEKRDTTVLLQFRLNVLNESNLLTATKSATYWSGVLKAFTMRRKPWILGCRNARSPLWFRPGPVPS